MGIAETQELNYTVDLSVLTQLKIYAIILT